MLLMESPCLSNGRGSIHRWIQDNGPGPHGDAIRWRYSSSLVVAWPTWSKLHVGNLANFLLDHHERRQQSEQEQEQRQRQRQQQHHPHHHHHHHHQEPTSHFPSFTCHPLLPCHARANHFLPSHPKESTLWRPWFSQLRQPSGKHRANASAYWSHSWRQPPAVVENPRKSPRKFGGELRIFGHRTVRGSTFASFIDLTELDDSLKIFGVSLYYLFMCPKYHNSPTTQPTPPKTTFSPPPSFPFSIITHLSP